MTLARLTANETKGCSRNTPLHSLIMLQKLGTSSCNMDYLAPLCNAFTLSCRFEKRKQILSNFALLVKCRFQLSVVKPKPKSK